MRKVVFLFFFLVSFINADIFSKGKMSIGAYLGKGESFERSYTIGGVNAEYCVVDNLAVGGLYRAWFGNTPTLNEFSLYSNYYFPVDRKFRPYLGVFLRQTSLSSELVDDFTSYGLRGGVSIIANRNAYVSLGYAAEYYDSCIFSDHCYRTYPELTLGISF